MTLALQSLSEADLVRNAQTGDRAAFGALYDAYLPRIYDFTLGMLRDRSDAEDATSETFLAAVEKLGGLREPAAFKGWLYTIARNAALRIVESRRKATPVGEHLESATTVQAPAIPQPEEHAERSELRALFDDAASTLSERDRTVFELTLRHGLGSAEVARVLRVRPAYAYILVNRLKGSVTEAIEAVVLARIGRNACKGLSELLDRFGTEVSPRMRKAVSRHARGCTACAETKRRRGALPVMLEGIAFAEPSATFAAQLASRIDALWGSRPPTTGSPGGGKLAHTVGAAVGVVVLSAALTGAGAQRTIVPEEEGPIAPASELLEAPALEPEQEQPAPQVVPLRAPQRRPQVQVQPQQRPAEPGGGDGDTQVTVSNGTNDTQTESGGANVSNEADVNASTASQRSEPDQGSQPGTP